MKCIVNGRILMPDGVIDGKALSFDRQILGIVSDPPEDAEIIDARGCYVSPGLIDVHCHGFQGMDTSHASAEELETMSRRVAATGVTAWLPTTMTQPWPVLEKCFGAVRQMMRKSAGRDFRGARILGCHAEGPFINPVRKGAQSGEYIQPPSIQKVQPWADVIRLITVAPEMPGALEFIQAAVELGIVVSMGHSDATAEEALDGIAAGVRHVTHIMNSMSPLNHRKPGLIGAALNDDRVYCEMIADTFHISPLLFPVMARLKPSRLVLITDSIECAGLAPGAYDLLGVRVNMDGIHCRLTDGTIAGSVLTMDRAVYNFAKYGDIPLWRVVNMASLYPARSISVHDHKGALQPGKDADIVIADADFHPRATFVSGECVYQASQPMKA